MAAPLANSTPFDPRLFEEDDDAEDLAYKTILHGIITLSTPPSQAAAQIDQWVTMEAKERLRRVKGRELTQQEKDSLYLVWPNPARHVDMIIGSVARLCSAYAPGHDAQNALIDLINALKLRPKHEVPSLSHDMEHRPVLDKTYSLWPFGTWSAESLAQQFRQEAENIAYPFSDVELPGSESQLRWRNLQAFIARLTTLDLIDCSAVSALLYILPASPTYPDLEARKLGGPQRIAADLAAASQWLESASVRSWVYEHCKSDVGNVWTIQNWTQWKKQLSFIKSDERFDEATRELALSLMKLMDAQDQV